MKPIAVKIGRGAEVAQSVEQRTENPRVIGSIPILGTFFAPLHPFSSGGILSMRRPYLS
jgi:hypothetical protein